MAEYTFPFQLENPCFLFKIWQKKEETENQKLHEEQYLVKEGSFVHFHIEIFFRTKYHLMILSNHEEQRLDEEEEPTIVKKLCINPRLFLEFPCTFQQIIFRLLSELDINDPDTQEVLIDSITSFACKVAKAESNKGLHKLEMCVDITEVF